MTSKTSYTFLGYTEVLSRREPVQQGTRFVHKGLHIFIPVLHHLFQLCSVLWGRATKPNRVFPSAHHTLLGHSPEQLYPIVQVPGRVWSCSALPQSVSSQAVLSSIIISLHRKLTAAQLLELEVGSLQAPSEGQSQEMAPFVPPQHLPPFLRSRRPYSDSQKHLQCSPTPISSTALWHRWQESPTELVFTCNGSRSRRPRFASLPGTQQHSCPHRSPLLTTVLWQFTNLPLEGIQKRFCAWEKEDEPIATQAGTFQASEHSNSLLSSLVHFALRFESLLWGSANAQSSCCHCEHIRDGSLIHKLTL